MHDPITLVGTVLGALLVAGGSWWIWHRAKTGARHARLLERNQRLGFTEPVSLHPRIDEHACICTGACVDVCPEKDVLAMVSGKPQLIHPSACIGHGECMRACPVGAIQLVIGTEQRGVDLPLVDAGFQTNVPGLYVAGELGGMGLIHNAVNQGRQAAEAIAKSAPPKLDGVHQVLIVGAGPAGLSAALAAKAAGLDFALLEADTYGGALRSYPRQKIVMTSPMNLALYGKVKLSRTTKESLIELWEDVIAKTGLRIEEGMRVGDVRQHPDGGFVVNTARGERRAQRVLLAVGRRGAPRKLGVPGEDLAKVTYKVLEPEQYAGRRCVVAGGGDTAAETALMLADHAEVVLCHRGDKFDRVKPETRERLEKSRVTVKLNTKITAITEQDVTLTGDEKVANDYVFVCIGGELPTEWLSRMGIEVKTMRGEVHPAMARA
jgi:thioredoxin reductase/NAD-dependent dihydropyrimidine dehydrogenase PreA subunit